MRGKKEKRKKNKRKRKKLSLGERDKTIIRNLKEE